MTSLISAHPALSRTMQDEDMLQFAINSSSFGKLIEFLVNGCPLPWIECFY
jgi:hypothetical protein